MILKNEWDVIEWKVLSHDGHLQKARKCLQYSSYYCLEVMTMSCQWEVFSETEKRQTLVTLEEQKHDSHITLLSRIKTFSFFLCISIEVSVSFGQEWKVGHTLQILLHISEMQKNFFYIFCHYYFLCLNRKMLVMQNYKHNFSLFIYYLAMYE